MPLALLSLSIPLLFVLSCFLFCFVVPISAASIQSFSLPHCPFLYSTHYYPINISITSHSHSGGSILLVCDVTRSLALYRDQPTLFNSFPPDSYPPGTYANGALTVSPSGLFSSIVQYRAPMDEIEREINLQHRLTDAPRSEFTPLVSGTDCPLAMRIVADYESSKPAGAYYRPIRSLYILCLSQYIAGESSLISDSDPRDLPLPSMNHPEQWGFILQLDPSTGSYHRIFSSSDCPQPVALDVHPVTHRVYVLCRGSSVPIVELDSGSQDPNQWQISRRRSFPPSPFRCSAVIDIMFPPLKFYQRSLASVPTSLDLESQLLDLSIVSCSRTDVSSEYILVYLHQFGNDTDSHSPTHQYGVWTSIITNECSGIRHYQLTRGNGLYPLLISCVDPSLDHGLIAVSILPSPSSTDHTTATLTWSWAYYFNLFD